MTVESWGSGKPDYFGGSVPARTTIITGQGKFIWSESYSLSPGYYVNLVSYTIPSNKRLSVSHLTVSQNYSCINKVDIVRYISAQATNYTAYRAWYDTIFHHDWGDLSAHPFVEDDILMVRIYNRSPDTQEIHVIVWGTIEDV